MKTIFKNIHLRIVFINILLLSWLIIVSHIAVAQNLDGIYKCPIEKVDILLAYPQFEGWATSNGTNNPTWYLNPIEDKVVTIITE